MHIEFQPTEDCDVIAVIVTTTITLDGVTTSNNHGIYVHSNNTIHIDADGKLTIEQ